MTAAEAAARTVLVVEDDPGTAELERRALVRAGVSVHAVHTVVDALAALHAQAFSAVLLDLHLPDGAPWLVLEAAQAKVPRVPVVIVTAMGNERIAAEALHRGVAEYVTKSDAFWDQLPDAVDRVARLARAEAALVEERTALAEAQRIAHLGSWKWLVDADEMTWSDEFWRILGADAATGAPTRARMLACVHPADRAQVAEVIARARATGEPFDHDYRVVRGDGAVRFVLGSGRAVADEAQRVIALTGIAQDVTERRQLETKLLFADRMASLGTLAAGVAHEINNPLHYAMANLDLIAEQLRELGGGAPSAAIRELLTMAAEAHDGAARVRTIVRGLRAFSRAAEERRESLEIPRLLEVAASMVANEIRHRARLVRQFAPVPRVFADEAQLVQVFTNLLVNAAYAIPEGRADRHAIRIATATDANGRAVVEVSDTGAGIPADVQHRVFDPFFTTKPVAIGTGLGLSICHGIVTALGGEITFESESGRGTTFRVALPASEVVVAPLPDTVSPRPARGRRGRVLIVDDDPLVLRSLGRVLSDEHDVHLAANGRDALAQLTGEAFDVVLCDLMMPEMTGMELYAEVLATAPERAARFVFVTGGAFTPSGKAFLDEVPNQRLEKPCEVAPLRALVRGLVRA